MTMKKSKLLALLLAAAMTSAVLLPGLQVRAAEEDGTTGDDNGSSASGVEMDKIVTENKEDGTYTIKLEAYATGEKVISSVTTDIPTDVVLVLDQSGSMANDMGTVSYEEYKDETIFFVTTYHTRNQDYYSYRHNGGTANLWHKLADGSYASVSVTKTTKYTALSTTLINYDTDWRDDLTINCYYNYANNLYEMVGTEYKKVELTRSGDRRNGYSYTYTFADGTTVTSSGDSTVPNLGTHAPLYTPAADDANTIYTYTYTDKNGTVQTIGTSTGANTRFTPAFYQRTTSTSGGGSRLAALQSAVTSFTNAVSEKAKGKDGVLGTDDDIKHRIAVVGFASQSGNGNNTELLSIAGRNSGSVGVAYNNITDQNLKDVLQDMDTTAGQTMVTNAANALAAEGATRIDLGLDMANRILTANPVPEGEQRNRVVIVFTDGSPTNNSGFQKNVANTAINTANSIKETNTTVYAIGIFSGADATSAGTEPTGKLDQGDSRIPAASNWFMQQVSSNNGTPRTPSYYLSAADTASLNNIFQQISSQIETGGSRTELDEKSVIRDVITPQFEMEQGAETEITVEKWDYIGPSLTDDNAWRQDTNFNSNDVKVTIDSTDGTDATTTHNRVNVTGFNFAENYAGEVKENGVVTYRGSKLVIKFNIKPRDGFIGGNNVITNADGSGIYEDKDAKDPVGEFEKPDVDVKIKDLDPQIPSADVYLGAYFEETVTKEEILKNSVVTVGGIELDLSKPGENYGLPDWVTKYVNINVEVTTSSEDLSNLTEDTTYTLKVTVTPKTDGTAKGGEATADGKIRVFKPVLDFQDSTVYYGAAAPTDANYNAANLVSTRWYHAADGKWSEDNGVTMLGTAPALTLHYTTGDGILNGAIATKQDIPVSVKVFMPMGKEAKLTDVTNFTTFNHAQCKEDGCTWQDADPNRGNPAFLLHVKTCTLTIKKAGGAAGEPYVFNILRNGESYTQLTITGNGEETISELPVGMYTVQEDMGWSWRYHNSATVSNGAALSASTPSGSIQVTNTIQNNNWLNGYSDVIANTFGIRR